MTQPRLRPRRLAQILACAADCTQRSARRWLAEETVPPEVAARIRRAATVLELSESELGRPVDEVRHA